MRRRATPLKMKVFSVTFTLTVTKIAYHILPRLKDLVRWLTD